MEIIRTLLLVIFEFDYQGRITSATISQPYEQRLSSLYLVLILDVVFFIAQCPFHLTITTSWSFLEPSLPIFSPCDLDSLVESCAGHVIPTSSISRVHLDSSNWFQNGCMIQVYPMIINLGVLLSCGEVLLNAVDL